MPFPLTDPDFDPRANAYTFKADIRDRVVHCFISKQAAEYLFGKLATIDDNRGAIVSNGTLPYVVHTLVEGKADEPIWITVPILHNIYGPLCGRHARRQTRG